ncbi:acyl-CoA thioesterase [Lignipirellula cremea]|uniref:1,4-dihydroxy-2-naphthoyl-CoA hydrolase n=1 Tax=Lignipirellula cremea TaxID=2528010 RepID=A0A518E3I5_9BACT|nr:thioesterase family protein [Lignipirellula cremea]QDU98655.1 1,4-dihydroxy-2-naphthoyl-CoA hydrolase [Lignipirellula cremea]
MPFPFETLRRVEFRDTDAAGIMHFSVYFTFMEEAEHEMLRSVGLSVYMEHEGAALSWPRVSVNCDYSKAVKFEDEIRIEAGLERIGNRSATYLFRFSRGEEVVATGRITSVCCRLEHDQPPRSQPIPAAIAARLAPLVMSE